MNALCFAIYNNNNINENDVKVILTNKKSDKNKFLFTRPNLIFYKEDYRFYNVTNDNALSVIKGIIKNDLHESFYTENKFKAIGFCDLQSKEIISFDPKNLDNEGENE